MPKTLVNIDRRTHKQLKDISAVLRVPMNKIIEMLVMNMTTSQDFQAALAAHIESMKAGHAHEQR